MRGKEQQVLLLDRLERPGPVIRDVPIKIGNRRDFMPIPENQLAI
jgi:hypothetical protein